MNNPIVTGSKNNTNRLSILIPKANAVNPNQNSSQFHSNPTLDCVVDTTIPIRKIIKIVNPIIVFLCFEISEVIMKNIDIGA